MIRRHPWATLATATTLLAIPIALWLACREVWVAYNRARRRATT